MEIVKKLTGAGASCLPTCQMRGSGYEQGNGAVAGPTGREGREPPEARGGAVGAAPHQGDVLARTGIAGRGPRGCQGQGHEHQPVRGPGSPTRRGRSSVAPRQETVSILHCLRVTSRERHPETDSRLSEGLVSAPNPTETGIRTTPLSWEGDVQGDVASHRGPTARVSSDRVGHRHSKAPHGGVSVPRNLRANPPLASQGDVQGDVGPASSNSVTTLMRPTRARSGDRLPRRLTRGEER